VLRSRRGGAPPPVLPRPKSRSRQQRQKRMLSYAELAACWNGPWWGPRCVHYCYGESCCRDAAATRERLSLAVKDALMSRRPAVPMLNKWSRVAPVLDWVLPLLCLNGLLPKLLENMSVPAVPKQSANPNREDLDGDLAAQLNFAVLRGIRYRTSCKFFADAVTLPTLLMVAFCLEPLRFLTAFWMRRSREGDDPTRIALLDVVNERFSPVVGALQYISTMLFAQNDRLSLLWRRFATTHADWCSQFQEQVRNLRRLLLVTAASIHRRHRVLFSTLHWKISLLGDVRASTAQREQVIREYDEINPCCLHAGTVRDLKASGLPGESLRNEDWHRFFRWRAKVQKQTIVDIEWKHGQNRKRANEHGQSRIANFCAQYVNCEAMAIHLARHRQKSFVRKSLQVASAGARVADGAQAAVAALGRDQQSHKRIRGCTRVDGARLRAASALQLYAWDQGRVHASRDCDDILAPRQQGGASTHIFDKAFWDEQRQALTRESAEVQAICWGIYCTITRVED
jgi:hypothetical protein